MAVKQPRYQHGEYIDLDWDACEPDALYVRGHVEPEEFAQAFNRYHFEPDEPQAPIPDPSAVVYEYGRWAIGTDYMEGGWRHYLKTYPVSGAGRFPITSVKPAVMERDLAAVKAYLLTASSTLSEEN